MEQPGSRVSGLISLNISFRPFRPFVYRMLDIEWFIFSCMLVVAVRLFSRHLGVYIFRIFFSCPECRFDSIKTLSVLPLFIDQNRSYLFVWMFVCLSWWQSFNSIPFDQSTLLCLMKNTYSFSQIVAVLKRGYNSLCQYIRLESYWMYNN